MILKRIYTVTNMSKNVYHFMRGSGFNFHLSFVVFAPPNIYKNILQNGFLLPRTTDNRTNDSRHKSSIQPLNASTSFFPFLDDSANHIISFLLKPTENITQKNK